MNDAVETVKLSTLEIISKYITVSKVGNYRYKAKCPFHQEKTASFNIDTQKGFYKCFGCGAGGDVIKFVQDFLKVDFSQALNTCCMLLGIENKYIEQVKLDQSTISVKELSVKALESCALYFQECLKKNSTCLSYLQKRGISESTCKSFRLGYFHSMKDFMAFISSAGLDVDTLVNLSILSKKDGKLYSMFENRLMIPISDKNSKVIAFGGRLLGSSKDSPKYVNSSTNILFNKSETLFNLDKAYKKNTPMIICEGYMDAIAVSEVGMRSLAPLGTACTESQIRKILSLSKEVFLCFDQDAAGQKATFSFLQKAAPHITSDYTIKIIEISNHKDIDEYIRAGGNVELLLVPAKEIGQYLFDSNLKNFNISKPLEQARLVKLLDIFAASIKDVTLSAAYKIFFKSQIFEHLKSVNFKKREYFSDNNPKDAKISSQGFKYTRVSEQSVQEDDTEGDIFNYIKTLQNGHISQDSIENRVFRKNILDKKKRKSLIQKK